MKTVNSLDCKAGSSGIERPLFSPGLLLEDEDLTAGVWIGNDNNRPMIYPDQRIGSGIAARAWGAFMRDGLADAPVTDFRGSGAA